MLVLCLGPKDRILIDGKTWVSLPPGAARVRLCFDAPKDVKIMRESVIKRMEENKEQWAAPE